MRILPILLALTGTAGAEARAPQQAVPQARKITLPPAQIGAQRQVQRPARKAVQLLLPILLEDSWHYLNPDKQTSTWESADVTFANNGVLLITQHAVSADLVLRGAWRAVDDSHIVIDRPYAPGKARYTLAACKDTADRISVCLFGPKL